MMVKRNRAKKIITLLLFFIGCGTSMFSNAMFGKGNKYDWIATESAPENYPMKIISGNLRYHKDVNERGLYVPAGTIFYQGWGNGVSTHVTGDDFKELPDQLSISYFSYTENIFYTGKFDLPYEKILKMFKDGTRDEEHPNWCHYIIVGVAPGGAVSVWVGGRSKRVEIFHGQAEKTDMDLVKIMDVTSKDRNGYVESVVKSSVEPAALEDMKKNGIPLGIWSKYRTQYHWTPVFLNDQPEDTRITYFNGEFETPTLPFNKDFLALTRPVPKYFTFKAKVNMNGEIKPNIFGVRFDPNEVMEVFAKLGANGEPLQLEFDTTFPRKLTQVRVRNTKESTTLQKCFFE